MTKTIVTVISSKRQDALEAIKPRFQFWFADEPQFAGYDKRGRFAALLLSYRAHPERYRIQKLGVHDYAIYLRGSDVVARIGA